MRNFFLFTALLLFQAGTVLAEAKEDSQIALGYASIGDRYVSEDKLELGARAYHSALTKNRAAFSVERRLEMIKRMAWTKLIDRALYHGQVLVSEHPGSFPVLLQYAEHLAWAGKNLEARRLTEWILERDPGNAGAKLIHAQASLWSGDPATAGEIFRTALIGGDNTFDNRMGLATSLFEQGYINSARVHRTLARATNPQQERELARFDRELRWKEDQSVSAGFGYYNDSDGNDRVDALSQVRIPWRSLVADVEASFHEANSSLTTERVNQFWGRVAGPLSARIYGDLGLGTAVHEDGGDHALGRASLELLSARSSVTFEVERQSWHETSAILANEIRYSGANMFGAYSVTDHFRPRLHLLARDYSDDNSSIRAKLDLPYTMNIGTPAVAIGYRQEFVAFDRQSGGGYFDPDELHSFQGFSAVSYYHDLMTLYFELAAGRQKSHRYGSDQYDNFAAFYGNLSWLLTPSLRLNLEGDGGDYALDTASGFNYYQLRASLSMLL